jgi:hypothetical protein
VIARRKFLAGAGAAAGAAAAYTFLPGAVRRAALFEARALGDAESWHVDDMWGHTPRYAQPIPHAGVSYAPVTWEHWDAIDHILMI